MSGQWPREEKIEADQEPNEASECLEQPETDDDSEPDSKRDSFRFRRRQD
jgi:hypothetical protein